MSDSQKILTPIETMFLQENFSRLYTLHFYFREEVDLKKKFLSDLPQSYFQTSAFDGELQILQLKKLIQNRGKQKSWTTFLDNLIKYLLELEEKEEVLIIGNGGAGLAGMIEYAASMNDDYLFIWSADHSLPNFKFHKTLHAAITYEPNIEIYMEKKKKIHEPQNIFVNSFHLVLPEEDFLEVKPIIKYIVDICKEIKGTAIRTPIQTEFETYFEFVFISGGKLVINYRKIVGFAFIYRFFETASKVYKTECNGECLIKWKQCFASRYNHSAMGENDKLAFVLGCSTLLSFLNLEDPNPQIQKPLAIHEFLKWNITPGSFLRMMLIPQPYDPANYSVLLDRMMDIWESTCMVRNPVWFPPDVLNYALDNDVYNINDTSFLHQSVIRLHHNLEIQNTLTYWSEGIIKMKEKSTRKKIEFKLDQLNQEEFQKFQNTITFESKDKFASWIKNIPPKHSYEYIKIINAQTKEFKTLKTYWNIPESRVVQEAPMPNYAQLWSPTNLPDNYRPIARFFQESFIEAFNEKKCKTGSQICVPFNKSEPNDIVHKTYLKDFKIALDHLGKYYLIEWAFGQYESMDDFIAEVTQKKGSEKLEINTCLNDKHIIPCYKDMTEKYFDKCFDGTKQISCVNTTINKTETIRSEDTLRRLFHHIH